MRDGVATNKQMEKNNNSEMHALQSSNICLTRYPDTNCSGLKRGKSECRFVCVVSGSLQNVSLWNMDFLK